MEEHRNVNKTDQYDNCGHISSVFALIKKVREKNGYKVFKYPVDDIKYKYEGKTKNILDDIDQSILDDIGSEIFELLE